MEARQASAVLNMGEKIRGFTDMGMMAPVHDGDAWAGDSAGGGGQHAVLPWEMNPGGKQSNTG